jgi:hypothetical protein
MQPRRRPDRGARGRVGGALQADERLDEAEHRSDLETEHVSFLGIGACAMYPPSRGSQSILDGWGGAPGRSDGGGSGPREASRSRDGNALAWLCILSRVND